MKLDQAAVEEPQHCFQAIIIRNQRTALDASRPFGNQSVHGFA
jgi:hypothetical protein